MVRSISLFMVLLCALVLAGSATAGDLSLSLNLEFNILNDLNSGGTWTVVGKADDRGIAGLKVRFVDSSLNFNPGTGFFLFDVFDVQVSGVFGGIELEIVDGQDPNTGVTLDVGVIGGTFPSTYVDDPDLAIYGANPDLGSFTGGVELFTGTFDPGDIPTWVSGTANANLFVEPGPVTDFADNVFITVRYIVPEPATCALFGMGLIGAVLLRRRK